LKIVLLAQFFQLVIQAQDLLNLGHHVHTKSTFESTSEMESCSLYDDIKIDRLMLERMNVLILHSYRLSCVVHLLLSQNLGD
jgi:hypothetical protein